MALTLSRDDVKSSATRFCIIANNVAQKNMATFRIILYHCIANNVTKEYGKGGTGSKGELIKLIFFNVDLLISIFISILHLHFLILIFFKSPRISPIMRARSGKWASGIQGSS